MDKLVKQLVAKKKEGLWWDFKREHHKSSLDLLHDILCLSNVIYPDDRYLIIGVSDDYKYFDVRSNNPRRKQSDIIDLLRAKNFAEDNMPQVTMETISINNNEIDIVIIKNKRLKPYYLLNDVKRERKTLKSGVIYSRIVDTNTPIDRCANPSHVEKMWKERFGLTLPAEERFKPILLDYKNWRYDGISKAYYSLDTDYSIEIKEDESAQEKFWWQIEFFEKVVGNTYILKHKDKELFNLSIQRFRSENLYFPFPDIEYIAYPDDQISNIDCYCDLFFYVKNTIEYSLFVHIRAGEIGGELKNNSLKTPIRTQIKPPIIKLPFLIFEDNSSKNTAIQMLKQNIKEFEVLSENGHNCEKLFSEWAFQQVTELI